jgi:hypothetical protein
VKSPRLRGACKRGALALAGIGLGFGMMEIGLRLVYPQAANCPIAVYDPELGHSLKPGFSGNCVIVGHKAVMAVRINEQGFRNRPIAVSKPADVYRILVLGDSYVFGWGLQQTQTFSALLEARLNQTGSRNYEVINAGVPRYGTAQEWLLYKRWVKHLDPDLVILSFYVGNDILDNLCENEDDLAYPNTRPSFTVVSDKLVPKSNGISLSAVDAWRAAQEPSRWSLSNLHAWILVRECLQGIVVNSPAMVKGSARFGMHFKFRQPSMIRSWYRSDTAKRGWEITQALLDALLKETRQQQNSLVLLILPSREQTVGSYTELVKTLGGGGQEILDFVETPDRPQRLLAGWAANRQVQVVDPLNPLKQAASSGTILVDDGHLNHRGNEVVADQIYRLLVTRDSALKN